MLPTSRGRREDGTPKNTADAPPYSGMGGSIGDVPSRDAENGIPRVDENHPLNDDVADQRETRWTKPFGAIKEDNREQDDTIRIATYNINRFLKMNRQGTTKFARMRENLMNVECLGMSELNRNWLKINQQQSLYNRLKPWWPHQKTVHTWLHDYEWHSEYQQGGASLTLTNNKIGKYGQEKGQDMSGLGRWVWQTVEGHSETKAAIIQVYRPTRNTDDNGSTYMQQRVAADEEDPLKIFDGDLLALIDGFIADKFQIIVMGDFNIPLEGRSNLERELKARGIADAIGTTYGYTEAPNTQVRGSKPIDAIFASETLQIVQGGYDRGRPEISDHRMIWADITLDSLLGVDRGDITKPRAKKLQISNRVVTKRFNQALMKQIANHKLLAKARRLEEEIGETKVMTREQAQRYEAIDDQRCRATAHAEERCTKRPHDNTAFSVELKTALGKAVVWQQMVKKLYAKQKLHKRWLIDMKEDLGIQKIHFKIPDSLEEAKQNSRQAFDEYKNLKQKAPELRSDFLDMLIQLAEDEGDESKAKYLRKVKSKEQSREVHQRIKMAQGKQRGGSGVRFVHKVQEDGTVETIKDKYAMEEAIKTANAAKLMSANESPIRGKETYDRYLPIMTMIGGRSFCKGRLSYLTISMKELGFGCKNFNSAK